VTPHPSESHPISLGAHAPGALQLRASGTTGAAAPTSRGPRRRLANAIRGSRQARPLAGRFQSGRASSPSVCPKRAASGQPAAVCGVFLPAVYFLWNTALVSCGGFLFWNTVRLSKIQFVCQWLDTIHICGGSKRVQCTCHTSEVDPNGYSALVIGLRHTTAVDLFISSTVHLQQSISVR
jgi:hypothetical protein